MCCVVASADSSTWGVTCNGMPTHPISPDQPHSGRSAHASRCRRLPAIDIVTLIYILVVGQFGLATGSGGITLSNVQTASRVYQIKACLSHALIIIWSAPTKLTLILTFANPRCQKEFYEANRCCAVVANSEAHDWPCTFFHNSPPACSRLSQQY
jgi:hypothetical protein